MAEHIIEILSLSDRPTILVFVTKGCCVNLTVSPLTGAPNTRGLQKLAIFNQYAAILETVIGPTRHIYCERLNSYVLYRIVPLSMTQSYPEDRTFVSRSRYSLKVNISQTVHDPLHIWFQPIWVFGVGGSNGAISGLIKSKIASDGHLQYINWP